MGLAVLFCIGAGTLPERGESRVTEELRVATTGPARHLRAWGVTRWAVALVVALVTAAIIGIPTGVIETSFYSRMTPVLWWNYPIWAATSVMTGVVFATYFRSPIAAGRSVNGKIGVGGILSAFAVGCPICNKIVVGLIGVSGALNVWAPIQPLLGLASLLLLSLALWVRLNGERQCKMPARSVTPTAN